MRLCHRDILYQPFPHAGGVWPTASRLMQVSWAQPQMVSEKDNSEWAHPDSLFTFLGFC